VNNSIGLKLGVAFAFLISILVGVGWVGLNRMSRIHRDLAEILDRHQSKVELARQAAYYANVNGRMSTELLLLDRRKDIDALISLRVQNRNRISGIFKEIESKLDSEQEKELLASVQSARSRATRSIDRALDLLNQGKPEEARLMVLSAALPLANQYHESWNVFAQFEQDQMTRARDQNEIAYADTRRTATWFALVAIAVASGTAVFVTRKMARNDALSAYAKTDIRKLNELLEQKVTRRTGELAHAVQGLENEITERMRTEEDRHALTAIIECSNDAITTTAPDGAITSWNAAAEKMYGYSASEVIGKSISIILPPGCSQEFYELRKKIERGERVAGFETTRVRKDGTKIEVSLTISAVPDQNGKITASSGIARDITQRKRAEQELRQSESTLAAAQRIAHLGSFVQDLSPSDDLEANQLRWSDEVFRIFGYEPGQIDVTRATFLRAVHPDDRNRLRDAVAKAIHERGSHRTEYRIIRPDGTERAVHGESDIVCDETTGKPLRIVGTLQDITERKQAEERFYKAFNANPEPITIGTISEGRYIDVNESFLRVTGYRREEVIGRTSLELKFWERPEDRAKLVEMLNEQGRVRDLEITFLTKSGERRTGLDSAEVIEVAGQKCIIAILKDITETKLLENQLRQAQKMEAIGQLSGGIAHDFNNLLSVIIGYSEVLEERLPPDDPLQKKCEQIKKAGQSAASLTRQLLAFSRQQVLEPRVLDLNAVVIDVETMLRRLIGEHIHLGTRLQPEVERVRADQGQIEQVIINLVVNARDAMPQGGRLTIETANVDLDEDYARRHAPQLPGPYVLLAVSDTGTGMDRETQAHVFEPFFTTKELGKGTGLGLSTVYGVVRQSGGHIWVYSELGQGTTFKIYLPRTAKPVPSEKPIARSAAAFRGTETILLVEDQDSLRELTCGLLTESGYTVLEAPRPDRAIEIARQHGAPIHLLLTDVVMPGMNGPALAEKLASVRPEMKVVYMSGYTGFTHPELLDSDATLVSKPFTREALLRKLHEELHLEKQSTRT
jgi:PAS domain S-box-containing protein